jgi:hypothetical protein
MDTPELIDYTWASPDGQDSGIWRMSVNGTEVPVIVARIDYGDGHMYCIRVPFSHEATARSYRTLDAAQASAEEAWMHHTYAPPAHRYVGPTMLRVEDLDRVKHIIKIKAVAEMAGLAPSSLASKVSRLTQLTIDESEALSRVLFDAGVVIERRGR